MKKLIILLPLILGACGALISIPKGAVIATVELPPEALALLP